MKKITAFFLAAILLLLPACKPEIVSVAPAIRIAGLKGPTSMGMIYCMEAADKGERSYQFSLHGSADEITPKLARGELDMAAVPANLASILYHNTSGAITVLAVNTYGVLYLVEKGENVTDFASLRGRTVYATGKGSTPEYTLRYLLRQNGLDPDKDLTLEFKSEPAEIVAVLMAEENAVAMLPQPYTTVAMNSVPGLHTVMDLNEEWHKLAVGSELITGVFVVRTEFLKAHPQQVEAFLTDYRTSVEKVRNDYNAAALLMEKFDIVPASIAAKALPYCNLTYLDGAEMKTALNGYLEILFAQNPKAVGGAVPADEFYYVP